MIDMRYSCNLGCIPCLGIHKNLTVQSFSFLCIIQVVLAASVVSKSGKGKLVHYFPFTNLNIIVDYLMISVSESLNALLNFCSCSICMYVFSYCS